MAVPKSGAPITAGGRTRSPRRDKGRELNPGPHQYERTLSTLSYTGAESSTLSKLAALACHPSTGDNEWQAAAIAFFRIHRRTGTSPIETHNSLNVSTFVSTANAFWRMRQTDPASDTIGFGKHKGRTVKWIVENDPAYVDWLLKKAKNIGQHLRDIFAKELRATYGKC